MDEVIGRMGGRFKTSITDSIMMWILHCAMDKAHERVHSKEGTIARLNEISKFYELAVMQLDGCLKFVREEADSSLESSDEEVLGDLTEIRDRLEGRLKESELAIAEKDRELTERLENELKLRQALELKARELDSLRSSLELERSKSEDVEELILVNRVSTDEDRDEFSELKNSVDHRVWNIKQKLDPEYNNVMDERRNQGFDSIKIEQMSSDIDMLKETLDLAFGTMQSAIFMSELEPIEQQWRWAIEKDTIVILIHGFMRDVLKNFRVEVSMQENKVSTGLSRHFSDMIKEITCLYEELEPLATSQNDPDSKITLKTKHRSSSEGDIYGKPNDSILSVLTAEEMNQHCKGDTEDGNGHYVAKMIKNHESIIHRKSEELNWLKRETLKEKKSSDSRREKDPDGLRRRIQDVILRMENLFNWNTKLSETSIDHEGEENEETYSTKRLCCFDGTEQVKCHTDSFEDIWKNKISVSHAGNGELHNEIRMPKREKEDANLQTMIVELCYVTLLEGLMSELCMEFFAYDLEMLIRDSMHEEILKETIHEQIEKIEGDQLAVQIREEIYYVVLREAVKDFGSTFDFALLECQDVRSEINCFEEHNLEGKLREEISRVFMREMCTEWNQVIEISDAESLVKEEMHRIAFKETIRDIANTSTCILRKFNEMKNSKSCVHGFSLSNEPFQYIEYLIKEDISMVFLRQMSKEWKAEIDNCNFESLIREEIYLLIVVEAAKEANAIYGEHEAQDYCKILEDFTSPEIEHGSLDVNGEGILVQKQDEPEEDLIQSASSEVKEYSAHLDLVEMKHEELDKPGIPREFLADIRSTFSSVTSKVTNALEQLALSKTLLSELRSGLGIASEDTNKCGEQMIPTVPVVNKMEPSCLELEENEEVKIDPPKSAFAPVMEFSEFMDFKCRVEEILGLNILRLEEAMHCLNPLAELFASLRRKESLYRKAFIRRSENLKKAETEVDLLADQVDVLLGLLEKVYTTLYHHSPVLQQYFEVLDILEMIKKELTGAVLASGE